MGYRLNRFDEHVLIAVSKPLLTEFGIHYRLEGCALHGRFFLKICSNFSESEFTET